MAASLSTDTTRLDFDANTNVRAITVSNAGDAPIHVQARILRWHDDGAGEVYSRTEDIAFSPALFTVPPHGSQVLRFALLAPHGAVEMAYRLLIDQLPEPAGRLQLNLPVRFIIPVFVAPSDARRPPILAWRADIHGGQAKLTACNSGTKHARLSDISVSDGGKPRMIAPGLGGYALAGECHGWSFRWASKARPASLDIAAVTEQGPLHQTVTPNAP